MAKYLGLTFRIVRPTPIFGLLFQIQPLRTLSMRIDNVCRLDILAEVRKLSQG